MSTAAANDSGELDELWAVPPEKFVAARNAAVTRARDEGDAKRAAELKALKRPTPSAWLVNALVRTAPKEVDAVFRAGDALIGAQGRVLAGADPDEMHAAMRSVREAIGRAIKRARAILAENGRKPTADLIRRVTATLRSASLDRRVREVVLAGRLASDPGADEVEALAEVRVPKRVVAKPTKKEPARPAAREDHAAKKHAERQARAQRAREEREAKQRAAREARERLRAEVAAAADAAEEARRALARAEAEERRARTAAEDASRAVEHAKRALTVARERHARAKKRAR